MNYSQVKPSPLLAPLVKQYWGMEGSTPDGVTSIQRIVPNGLLDLVIYLGDKPDVLDQRRSFSDSMVLCGHPTSYYDIIVPERLSLFAVSFLPGGVRELFDIPANELLDCNIPLRYILRDSINQLEDRLMAASTFEERVAIAENFLMACLYKNRGGYDARRMASVIYTLNRNLGALTVDELAAESCLCRRQFERHFLTHVGISPKQFIRIVRFQYALYRKSFNRAVSLTELAHASGYYDQSHMINDFKALAGITPSKYFAECEPLSDYFLP